MVPTQVGDLNGLQSLWYSPEEVVSMPQFEEILPPPFVSLTVGGPVHGFSHDSSIVSDTRVLSFVPTRMHSGLEMSV
jgi:hypothetical protein